MTQRLRFSLLVAALLLTGLGAGVKAPAQECAPGTYGWIDFGTCCPYLNATQLLRARCVDGYWEPDSSGGYKCVAPSCW